ncbi:MAG: hypothetical protein WCI52_01965 [bacterium]
MKDPQEILVVQVSTMGIYGFCSLLKMAAADRDSLIGLSLVKDEDFLIFPTAHEIENLVFVNKPQLLITGIVSDRVEDVAVLVERLRLKNPQLVVVTFSTCNIPGSCFDRQIAKMKVGSASEVIKAVADFRGGALRR